MASGSHIEIARAVVIEYIEEVVHGDGAVLEEPAKLEI